MTMTLTTGAASLSRTTMRSGDVLPLRPHVGGGGSREGRRRPRQDTAVRTSPDNNVQCREGNENKYFVPYFSRIRRRRWGHNYDGRRRRKGGGGRRWSAMDPPLPNLGGP